MTELAARLQALRRQAGVSTPRSEGSTRREPAPPSASHLATPPPAPPAPRSPIPEEIRRLLGVRVRAQGATVVPLRARPVDREFPGEEIAPGLIYTEAFQDAPALPTSFDAAFARLGEVHTRHLLAFDTETTGLAGGTGTRAFQIGAADVVQGRLRLRQLTTLTLGAEPALLATFAQWLAADTVLLSYNGKSYDAPLLATRYRLARRPDPLRGRAHLDLLHPVRRRWRGHWPNCRLATAEHRLLGVLREDDLPGSEAPRAWLDYLRGGDATDLRRVAAHNARDLRSLVGVLAEVVAREANGRAEAG